MTTLLLHGLLFLVEVSGFLILLRIMVMPDSFKGVSSSDKHRKFHSHEFGKKRE